jgi:hypothetical protein
MLDSFREYKLLIFVFITGSVLCLAAAMYWAGQNAEINRQSIAGNAKSDVLAASQSANLPTPTPPQPTPQNYSAPATVKSTITLVDCVSYGITLKVTQAYCDYEKERERESREKMEKALAEASKPLNVNLDPPALTPLMPSPTPPTCNYAAKAAYDESYRSDSSRLYQDYQNALAQINAAGAIDSNATNMAHKAYSKGQTNLNQRHAAN